MNQSILVKYTYGVKIKLTRKFGNNFEQKITDIQPINSNRMRLKKFLKYCFYFNLLTLEKDIWMDKINVDSDHPP